jgi:hypothetical protein
VRDEDVVDAHEGQVVACQLHLGAFATIGKQVFVVKVDKL